MSRRIQPYSHEEAQKRPHAPENLDHRTLELRLSVDHSLRVAHQGAWRRTHTVPPSFDRGQTEGGRGPSREHRGSDPAGGSTGFWKEFWARQEAGAGARSSPGQCGGFAAGAPAYGRGAPSFSRRHFSTQDAWASWKPQPPPTPPTPPQRPPQRPASAAATRRAPPPADTSGMNEAAVLTTLEASLQRLRLSSVDEQKRATKELMARGSEGIQGGARRRPASSSGSRIGAKSCSASDRARAAAGHGPLGGNDPPPVVAPQGHGPRFAPAPLFLLLSERRGPVRHRRHI
ncbi:unnamed protein product [Prorocentrum cordatum]|uniref:Uncharacterized protein n=1 Tax=Prorocentrum cordatum TaxID=2364126 RepID=A0ABN9T687_9DINO|nr:unnamed protein product [Polarella glacialis]